MTQVLGIVVALVLLLLPQFAAGADARQRLHGMAMHDAPALAPGATLSHVNPEAPKGGRIVIGLMGSFDSLNPFIVRGQALGGLRTYVYEALMVRNPDEPFTLYGLVAEAIEVPDDRTSITFHLNPAARFSDGRPISSADIEFSWEQLRTKGWPNLRNFYGKVERVVRVSERTIRFEFPNANDRELPMILGLMPILPAHAIDPGTFDQTTLQPPIASGPYRVKSVDPGSSVVLERDPNWWARDLPIMRGLFNFDEIRYEFFRDSNSLFEAFKKGLVDFRMEDDPNRWASAYDFPAVADGRVIRETFTTGLPRAMFGFVFNTRRPIFGDRRVREALIETFDFTWINANLYAGGYRRTESFFQGSDLSALGRPAGAQERAFLARFPDAVTPEVLEGRWRAPTFDGSGFDRQRIRRAIETLRAAGWTTRDGRLVDQRGQPFAFEAIVSSREHERLLLAWKRVLDRIGIELSIRQVDSAQFERRRQTYDFDMVPWAWGASLSPGNEQAFRWGSRAAEQPGSLNLAGVRNPAIDAAIAELLDATTREELVVAARVLDRLLISGLYVLPLHHQPEQRLARWSHLRLPQRSPLFGPQIESWWSVPR